MDIVAVDILSGLPETPDGYKYVLVISDYFTKFSRAFALKDAEASTCMRVMYDQFFALFGLPRKLHSDQGKNFEGKLFKELCQLAGVDKSHTTAFHPQCDGQVERLNRTLLQMLRTTIEDDPASWPQRLPTLMAAYRMSEHAVTGVTPNMAMLGREVRLPATLIARPPEEPVNITVPFVRDLRDVMRNAHQKVRAKTQAIARTQKRYYDERTTGNTFEEGQLVWLFWPRPPHRQRFKKLAKMWTGPWRILRFTSSVTVLLQHVDNGSKQRVHVDRLMACKTPDVAGATASTVVDDSAVQQEEHQQNQPVQAESVETSGQGRPQRARRLPRSLEPYVLPATCL